MKFNKSTLKNGMRVVTIPMADNPSVTVLVMVEAGSKYEDKKTSGVSHFLEHMMFKGTPKRPKAADISRELDSLGANYNAFTSQELTGYYAKAAAQHLDTIIDIISDMYTNPLFEESEIKKEKGVIIEEMRMYQDLPQRHVQDVLLELLYGDQPAGWNVIGNEGTIRSFTREDFVKYRKNHYGASAATIIISGSLNESEILGKLEKAFGSVEASPKETKLAVVESQKAPAIKIEFKETDQTHLVIAARTFHIKDPRIPTMMVLSTILGGGMSSRLFNRMREELGICYYIRTSHDTSTDHGFLSISAGVDNTRVEEAVKEILKECKRMSDDAVPAHELQKAKDHIAGTTLLDLETSEARAEFCGSQEVLKKAIESPEEIIKKVNVVTAEDVQKLAEQIFVNEGLNLALIGRFKDGEGFKDYFKF